MNNDLVLEKIKIACVERFSDALIDEMRFDILQSPEDFMADTLSARLIAFVYGRDVMIETLESIHYPANWAQAVKRRFAPKWFLSRWPVQYIEVATTVKHVHICPHLNIKTEASHLLFMSGELPNSKVNQ